MKKIYFGQLAKMDISRYMMFKAWMVGDIKSLTKSLGRTLAYMCVCIVSQLCLTLCDLMVCSLTVSSVHQIFQARILEWVAIPFSRESSQPRDLTWVSCIGRWILYH